MKSIYSIIRSSLLIIIAFASLLLSMTINEFGFFFGVALLIGGALTAIYLFIHFDETLNEKVIMEALIDVFAGLVLLTFPEISQRFVLVDFAFWIAMMGILYLSGGFFNHKKSNYFWLYVLSGLALIIFGFIVMNYNPETLGSVNYLMSFAVILYGIVGIYLAVARKKVPFQ
ncbi:MAG: hypothetical protein A2W85_08825 [Bacteroidetes bacterium GWF2_41_31]|nr:MAG: hypothetical protein A2W85_08825 [Bacteroidetes bacterium GWF2_41_31]